MNYRIFPRTGWRVSEIGLGCWQLGGDCWGDMDGGDANAILQSSVDAGVNFFDTADVYGDGRSEEFIGRFIRECPEEIHVATKLGRRSHVFPDQFTPENLRACTEDSLRKLGLNTLDLTQLHCLPIEALRKGHVFEIMRDLQAEGKIRHWGVSVESMEEALICLGQEGCISMQIIFNIFRQKPVDTLFKKAEANGTALIIRLPLASGLLSGRMSTDQVFPENDHRNFNRDGQHFNVGETFAGLPYPKGVQLADELGTLLPDDIPMPQAALRWILDHEAVTVVIPGASRVDQVKSNARASNTPSLPQDIHHKLRDFYTNRVHNHIRGSY